MVSLGVNNVRDLSESTNLGELGSLTGIGAGNLVNNAGIPVNDAGNLVNDAGLGKRCG